MSSSSLVSRSSREDEDPCRSATQTHTRTHTHVPHIHTHEHTRIPTYVPTHIRVSMCVCVRLWTTVYEGPTRGSGEGEGGESGVFGI